MRRGDEFATETKYLEISSEKVDWVWMGEGNEVAMSMSGEASCPFSAYCLLPSQMLDLLVILGGFRAMFRIILGIEKTPPPMLGPIP